MAPESSYYGDILPEWDGEDMTIPPWYDMRTQEELADAERRASESTGTASTVEESGLRSRRAES